MKRTEPYSYCSGLVPDAPPTPRAVPHILRLTPCLQTLNTRVPCCLNCFSTCSGKVETAEESASIMVRRRGDRRTPCCYIQLRRPISIFIAFRTQHWENPSPRGGSEIPCAGRFWCGETEVGQGTAGTDWKLRKTPFPQTKSNS